MEPGSNSIPVVATSIVNNDMSFSARLQKRERSEGVLIVEGEAPWLDGTEWGAGPFTDEIGVSVLPNNDPNSDLPPHVLTSMPMIANVVKWRIQNLRPGTHLWLWQDDSCCSQFQCATVQNVGKDSFKLRLNNGSLLEVECSLHTHVGYSGKIFRVLQFQPPVQKDIVVVAKDGNLYCTTVDQTASGLSSPITLETGEKYAAVLHSFNHSPSLLTVQEFRRARLTYCKFLVENKNTVMDGLTGQHLNIEKQLLRIALGEVGDKNPPTYSKVSNAAELAREIWIRHNSTRRHRDGVVSYAPVVICSKAGSGKTWASQQMRYTIAKEIVDHNDNAGLEIPLLIPVQQLVALVEEKGFTNLLRRHIRQLTARQIGLDRTVTNMLLMAVNLRSAILIVDGIDEAGDLSHDMQLSFLMRDLILNGYTVVATTRPEGLLRPRWSPQELGVSTLNLLPLTELQQRKYIGQQTGQGWLIDSLHGASEVTKLLDKEWRRIRNTSGEAAEALEKRGSQNLNHYPYQKVADSANGVLRCIKVNVNDPQSGIIQVLKSVLKEHLLRKLQEVSHQVDDSIFTVREAVEACAIRKVVDAALANASTRTILMHYGVLIHGEASAKKDVSRWLIEIFTDLVVLARAFRLSTFTTWTTVKSETDEVYLAVEANGRSLLEKFLQKLVLRCRDTMAALGDGSVKRNEVVNVKFMTNPVRLYEGAVDAHSKRKIKPATAYSCNAVKGSLTLTSLADINNLLEHWPVNEKLDDGTYVAVQLLRVTNLFSTKDSAADPFNFRRVCCCIRLGHEGTELLAELELHHKAILRIRNRWVGQVTRLNDYCRMRFRETQNDKLRDIVETYKQLYSDAAGNPAQLSLLCHVLVHDATATPPHTTLQLYQMAMRTVLQQRLKGNWKATKEILKSLAVYLMLKAGRKRIFTSSDAIAAVGTKAWQTLLQTPEHSIPLIKRLDVDRFEFQHRSFQEALLAEALSDGVVSADEFMSAKNVERNWRLIASGDLANVWRIGGQSVGCILKRGLGQPMERIPAGCNDHVWSALFSCLVASHTLALITYIETTPAFSRICGPLCGFCCMSHALSGSAVVLQLLLALEVTSMLFCPLSMISVSLMDGLVTLVLWCLQE